MPKTAGPPWRTIFRFNGDYSVLLPRTAFRKAAGPAGRASSGDPTPPPSRTSRVHCSWNNGPRSFQDQGEPIGCRPQQSPGPWQTPWQLDRSLGEHTDDHVSSGSAPECAPHTTHPRSRRGAARERLTAGAHPWPSKPSCPRCAVSRHLAGDPGAPRATTHGVTSSAGRAGAVPPRVEALPPPSLPSPSHTQTGFQLPPVCSGNRPKPPPIRPWDPLRMKPPRDVRDGNRGGRRPAKNPRWSFVPASSTRVSQVPAWALPWGPARRRVTYPERCPRPADQLPGLSLELGELRVAVTAPSASTGRVALLCAWPGALGRRAAATWVLLRTGGQPLAGGHFQQLQRLPGRAALGHLRGGRGQ